MNLSCLEESISTLILYSPVPNVAKHALPLDNADSLIRITWQKLLKPAGIYPKTAGSSMWIFAKLVKPKLAVKSEQAKHVARDHTTLLIETDIPTCLVDNIRSRRTATTYGVSKTCIAMTAYCNLCKTATASGGGSGLDSEVLAIPSAVAACLRIISNSCRPLMKIIMLEMSNLRNTLLRLCPSLSQQSYKLVY